MKHKTLHGWPIEPDVDSTPTPRETPAAMRMITPYEELVAIARRLPKDEQRKLLSVARYLMAQRG